MTVETNTGESTDLVLGPVTGEFINFHQDYETQRTSMFLGSRVGLMENLRNEFPETWGFYKQLKALDWEETEMDISTCLIEFQTAPEQVARFMTKNLSWQYETDCGASEIANIIMPFVNNTELKCYLQELGKNESLHALAYKFIVESSFENPHQFIRDLLEFKQSFSRLKTVQRVFFEIEQASHLYAQGKMTDEHELRKLILKFWVTVFSMERVQFMQSFSVTFWGAEGDNNYFVPIAKLVQKIATDEFQVHVQAGRAILKHELKQEVNFAPFIEILDEIIEIIKEIGNSEFEFLDDLFGEDEFYLGMHKNQFKRFVLYAITDVCDTLGIESPFEVVTDNPFPWMNKWLLIDSNQASPQEESVGNYLLGNFRDNRMSFDRNQFAEFPSMARFFPKPAQG